MAPRNKGPTGARGRSADRFFQPHFIYRNLQLVTGSRPSRRPSAIAKKAGKRRSSDVLFADEFEGSTASWATKEPMPVENNTEDHGWQAGPIVRDLPAFHGPTPGPTNPSLMPDSSEIEIMADLLTREFKHKCHEFTLQHVESYRRAHSNWESTRIETAFGKQETRFLRTTVSAQARFCELFDVWIAAKLRIAQIKPEIPASALWGRVQHAQHLHDKQLDAMLTYPQFQWCNRHMAFAECGDGRKDDETDEDDGCSEDKDSANEEHARQKVMHDTFRKRRELTNMLNKAFSSAYNPHQHCGLDEATRATKHWEKIRIRFKASVHSGTLVDMLNDCRTSYCLWFQEQTWNNNCDNEEDPNAVETRLRRAAKVLVDKQHDESGRSTANYCISLDRGYGHVSAQRNLWELDGVYSNSIVQSNRVGLPRQFIDQVAADLASCPPRCTHASDAHQCRKYMWTVVHKNDFELCLWQDSKLILSFGNFFSGSRAGILSRGGTGEKDSYGVWAPESIFHYNIEGRSATDTSDQARKKMTMAERRQERAGPKGIGFVFDIAFTNGAIIQRMLQPDRDSRHHLDRTYNKVKFCLKWSQAILHGSIVAFRVNRMPHVSRCASICSTSSSRADGADTQGCASGESARNHTLIDLPDSLREEEARRSKSRGRPRKKPRSFDLRGVCGEYDRMGNFVRCAHAEHLPKRTHLFCPECKRYYHLPCYFEHHYSRLMK